MKNNRVYIATKTGLMEGQAKQLRIILEKLGYEIIYDWTEHTVPRPFAEYIPEVTAAANIMAQAVMQCDILIVLYAENGIGFHIEMGGALMSSVILSLMSGQKKKHIFVVGQGNERSIFYFHELVTRVPDISALMEELGKLQK